MTPLRYRPPDQPASLGQPAQFGPPIPHQQSGPYQQPGPYQKPGPYQQPAPHRPQQPAPFQPPYPGQPYPPQPYPSQSPPQQYLPQPYPPQSYPAQYPLQPTYGGYPQYLPSPPRQRSVVPVVLLCVIALVAVLGVTALVQNRETQPTTSTYQNDDYTLPVASGQAPRMPAPNKSEAESWLTDNKIYSTTMAQPVRCEATPADATSLSDAEMQAQLNDVLDCLLRVWGPALEQAGFTATRPTITVMSTTRQTACGKMRMQNAMFCGSDQNLYFASDLPELFSPSHASKKWVIESVLAHEYAHAFQGRTGIIPARNLLADETTTKEASYLLVRRNEAQADCLSGMFFNATRLALGLSAEDENVIIETFRSIGSDRGAKAQLSTHPKMATRKAWVMKGLQTTDIGACNTYLVPADEVA